MKKKSIAVIALTATVLVATAACSGGGGANSSGGTAITYWASNQGTSLKNDRDVLAPELAKFTKQTGIKVTLEVIGWNDLQTRIQTAATSGQAPDVVNIGNTWATSLQATGAFMPYDPAAMKAIGGADKFVTTALNTGGAPGKPVTSVPLYGLAYGLYYNRKMFADAGLTAPTTWEEMVADAKKLTSASTGVTGMTLAAGSYTENSHFAFINSAQNGASLFDASGKPTFTGSGVVDGIKRYLDLMQSDRVANIANSQYTDAAKSIADFANGKAAMVISQNNADSTISASGMTSDRYGVVPFPAPAAGKKIASFIAGINLSIFKNSKNKDAALQFVKFMTSEATQGVLGKPYASLPVLKGLTPTFTDNAEEAKVFAAIYNTMSQPLPLVPAEDQFESTVGKAMNNMFATIATGGTVSSADIRAALQTAQDQVTATIG